MRYLDKVFLTVELGDYDILEAGQLGERDVQFTADLQMSILRKILRQTFKPGINKPSSQSVTVDLYRNHKYTDLGY